MKPLPKRLLVILVPIAFFACSTGPSYRSPASQETYRSEYETPDVVHSEIPASEMLKEMSQSGELTALMGALTSKIQSISTDPTLSKELTSELSQITNSQAAKRGDFSAVDHFPVIKLSDLGKLRLALASAAEQLNTVSKTAAAPAPAPISGELSTLLGPCNADKSLPPPITPAIPELFYADFPDTSMSDCEFSQSQSLADILMALARGGSAVSVGGTVARSPRELFQALVASGHTVEMRNERTFANFLSFIYKNQNVRWPVWVDTQVALPSGGTLVIPMGHSQHSWRISGPLVNARVMYYLGISGVGFFPQNTVRAPWTGLKAEYILSSADPSQLQLIDQTLDAAEDYSKRNQWETQTIAKGLPADGYGYVGVCNDSTAVLEKLSLGGTTEFPLLRASRLDFPTDGKPRLSSSPPGLDDGLDPVFSELPHDGDAKSLGTDAVCRILQMAPFDLSSQAGWFDPALRSALLELQPRCEDPRR